MGNKQKSKPEKLLKPTELQTYLVITQVKLNQGRSKKIALIKRKQDEIIKYLNNNNLDIAKAKMDSLMREEDYITVFDILGPLCEIIKEKVTYLMTSKECPEDLRASLDTLIFSSNRLEIEELHMIREFIGKKFTNIYVDKANSNTDNLVNILVLDKLTIKQYPEAELICRLKAICERENIEFSFPQLVNPLIIDNNLHDKTKIPTIPIFNKNDVSTSQGQEQNQTSIPTSGPNFNNMPIPLIPMNNNFPQGNPNLYFQTQMNHNFNNTNFPNPILNPVIPPILNTKDSNLNKSNSISFPSPNNLENNNIGNPTTHNLSKGVDSPLDQLRNDNANHHTNNLIIPPINSDNKIDEKFNNISSDSSFPSMPNAYNTFAGPDKRDNFTMMSGGFSNILDNNLNVTFPETKSENLNNLNEGFTSLKNLSPGENKPSQNFPDINNQNFNDNLKFPSIENSHKKNY